MLPHMEPRASKPRYLDGPRVGPLSRPHRPSSPPLLEENLPRQFNFPFAVGLLKKPMPAPVLDKEEAFTFSNLMRIMENGAYTQKSIQFAKVAYKFIEKLYLHKQRDDGTLTIVHPLAAATRAAKMGLSKYAICAALLHDAVEDTNKKRGNPNRILPEHITTLFGPEPSALQCGKETLKLVLLLTKPKYLERNKKWVFPEESSGSQYFILDDDYYSRESTKLLPGEIRAETSLYDDRSDAYYSVLLNSGNIEAIVLKLLDNIHNAETTLGITKAKAMKNLRTMARNTMRHAAIFFVEDDVQYLKDLFRSLGIDIERSVTPIIPTDPVITLKLRDRFDISSLLTHPDPQYAYITIYGSNPSVALAMDYVEIGLPPRLGLDYNLLLQKYLCGQFFIDAKPSAVPPTSPVHEIIFRISGFTEPSERSKVLRPEDGKPNEFELLDENGKVASFASLLSIAKGETRFGPHVQPVLFEVEQKYSKLKDCLSVFYQNEIYPLLEELEVNQPSIIEKN